MYFPNDIFPYFTLLHIVYECLSFSDIYISIYFYILFMSVEWDVKLCLVSRTTPLPRKGFRRRLGSLGPPGILKNFTNDHRLNNRRKYSKYK